MATAKTAPKAHAAAAHATTTHAPTPRRPSWRSRKVWIPIVGLAALLVAGYITTAQFGLG